MPSVLNDRPKNVRLRLARLAGAGRDQARVSPPGCGIKSAKGARWNPMSAVGRRTREDLRRPARSRCGRTGSGTPRGRRTRIRRMTRDETGRTGSEGARVVGSFASVTRARKWRAWPRCQAGSKGWRRVEAAGYTGHTRTNGRRRTARTRATGRLAAATSRKQSRRCVEAPAADGKHT